MINVRSGSTAARRRRSDNVAGRPIIVIASELQNLLKCDLSEQVSVFERGGSEAWTTIVAVSTVKTHLQRIFVKPGYHRQSELMALSASMRLPIE